MLIFFFLYLVILLFDYIAIFNQWKRTEISGQEEEKRMQKMLLKYWNYILSGLSSWAVC